MWNPFEKRTADVPTDHLRQNLVARGMTAPMADKVRVAHHTGQYASRKVTFFRVYDPQIAPAGHHNVIRFEELKQDNVVEAGWTEGDGAIKFYSLDSKGYNGKPSGH